MIQKITRILLVFLCVVLLACAGCKKGKEPAEAQKEAGAVVRQKVAVSPPKEGKAAVQEKAPAVKSKEATSQEMKEKSKAEPTGVKAQKEAQEAGVSASPEGTTGGTTPSQVVPEEVKTAENKAAQEGEKKVAEAEAGPATEEQVAEEKEATPKEPKEAKEAVEAAPKTAEGVEPVEKAVAEGTTPGPVMETSGKRAEEQEQGKASVEEGKTVETVEEVSGERVAVAGAEGQESTESEQIKIDLGEISKEKGTESAEAEAEEEESIFNPFMPLFKKESKTNVALETTDTGKKRAFLTPLERIGLSQLRLTGIVMAPSGNRAIVADSTGKGYVIRKGTYIGLNSGVVEKITEDRVIIVETIGGRKAVTELKLQKEAGE